MADASDLSGEKALSDEALQCALGELQAAIEAGDKVLQRRLLLDQPELNELLPALLLLQSISKPAAGGKESTSSPIHPHSAPGVASDGLWAGFSERYTLQRELGRGGMGVVYLAEDSRLKRQVALKLLLSGALASEEQRRRFAKEARAAAGLRHPGIVAIHDVGDAAGVPYFTMDYLPGKNLAQRLSLGPFAADEAAQLIRDAARALHYLHGHGVLHRDIKPGNLLFDAQGRLVLGDFGLARQEEDASMQTVSNDLLGTLRYMPPEQAFGPAKELSPRSDVYSMGAVLYEMVCGKPAITASGHAGMLLALLEREPIRPRDHNQQIPLDLERIILRCLSKDPARRYETAEALALDLDRFLRKEPLAVAEGSPLHDLARWARREPAWAAHLGGILLLSAVVGVQFTLFGGSVAYHAQLGFALFAWLLGSALCSWLLKHSTTEQFARLGWAILDAGMLSFLHVLANDPSTPLHAGYPLLIAASGLWFRVYMVYFTLAACLAGYGTALAMESSVRGAYPHYPATAILMFVLTALVVAYQVRRLMAVSSYLERDIS